MTDQPHVLVTGASGFTGQHLIPALKQQGYRVTGTGKGIVAGTDLAEMDLTNIGDVTDLIRHTQPDYVIHLAALSFVAHPEPADFYQVNTLGTENLLSALASQEKPVGKIILASTANVYGRNKLPVLAEHLCPQPVNHYGCSKLAMEHMASNWFEKLPILITRPFNYTGPGQPPHFLVPKMVSHYARRASSIELGNLDVARDISDVRDICNAYIALLQSEGQSETVNLCSGTTIHLRGLMAILSELAGYQIEINVNPDFVRANEIASMQGDRSRFDQLAGSHPIRSIRGTLRDMLEAAMQKLQPNP